MANCTHWNGCFSGFRSIPEVTLVRKRFINWSTPLSNPRCGREGAVHVEQSPLRGHFYLRMVIEIGKQWGTGSRRCFSRRKATSSSAPISGHFCGNKNNADTGAEPRTKTYFSVLWDYFSEFQSCWQKGSFRWPHLGKKTTVEKNCTREKILMLNITHENVIAHNNGATRWCGWALSNCSLQRVFFIFCEFSCSFMWFPRDCVFLSGVKENLGEGTRDSLGYVQDCTGIHTVEEAVWILVWHFHAGFSFCSCVFAKICQKIRTKSNREYNACFMYWQKIYIKFYWNNRRGLN